MRALWRALVPVMLIGTAIALVAPAGPRAIAQAPQTKPNILVIVTDDQREAGTLATMPSLRRLFQKGGRRFTDAYATTPVCCPSRASIFTGRYTHNHGIHTDYNDPAFLDHAEEFQASTVQRYLKDAGYRTAVYGKYFNGWDINNDPPYFDRWGIFEKDYLDTQANVNGIQKTLKGYSTTFVSNQAASFLDETEADDGTPWFLYVAPYAPHDPRTPERRYRNAEVPPFRSNPATLEEDRRDKPDYAQQEPPTLKELKQIRKGQLRTLMSVDDMVERLLGMTNKLDERNTLAFFLSDNGYLWGEHGLTSKNVPYTGSIRIPLLVRWPGNLEAGTTDDRLAATIDIAPTIAEVVGFTPDPAFDGRSLLSPSDRSRIHTEFYPYGFRVPWASTRTRDYQYTEYYRGSFEDDKVRFAEYYDIVNDPWQLTNLLHDDDTTNDPDTTAASEQLRADLMCAGETCP